MLQTKARCNHRALNPHSGLPMYCGLNWDHTPEERHLDRNYAHSWDGDGIYCDHEDRKKGVVDAEAQN